MHCIILYSVTAQSARFAPGATPTDQQAEQADDVFVGHPGEEGWLGEEAEGAALAHELLAGAARLGAAGGAAEGRGEQLRVARAGEGGLGPGAGPWSAYGHCQGDVVPGMVGWLVSDQCLVIWPGQVWITVTD